MQSPFITAVDENNIHSTLEESMKTPVLFLFWSASQPESVQSKQIVETLAQQYQGQFLLATLDCDQHMGLASQFGVQMIPTLALFTQGQPVDGLGGPQSQDSIQAMLAKHLPSQAELIFNQAQTLHQQGEYAQALALLKQLESDQQQQAEVKLITIDCLLETQQFSEAKPLLESIPLEYQQGFYEGLVAKLTLHENAANSPELQKLEQEYANAPKDNHLACHLAAQYHEAHRDEDALAVLWPILQHDLNALDGEVKKTFMDILSALGQGNALSAKYRRQLYSLLY